MNEIHTTLESTEAVAPQYAWPTNPPDPPPTQWGEVYDTPNIVETVTASVINTVDDAVGTSAVALPVSSVVGTATAVATTLAVVSNLKPYWWPDLTGLTQGSFHSTPYTGPPQPIGN